MADAQHCRDPGRRLLLPHRDERLFVGSDAAAAQVPSAQRALLAIFMDSTNPVATEKPCVKILHCEVVNIYFHDRCGRVLAAYRLYHAELRVRSGAGTAGAYGARPAPSSSRSCRKTVAAIDVPKRGKRARFDGRRGARATPTIPVGTSCWPCRLSTAAGSEAGVSVLEIVKHVLGLASTEDEGFDSFDNKWRRCCQRGYQIRVSGWTYATCSRTRERKPRSCRHFDPS